MSRRSDRDELDVEELNVGAWGNPGDTWGRPGIEPPSGPPVQGPPTGPPRREEEWSTSIGRGGDGPPPGPRARSWLQRHTNQVVAGVGGVALLVAVVAVVSGPGGDPAASPTSPPTTVAPSTTQGRPVPTAAPSTTTEAPGSNTGVFGTGNGSTTQDDVDYRFALTEAPDGYEPTGVDVIDPDEQVFTPGPPMLFAADGTSWATGPWLLISSATEFGPGVAFPFERPPLPFTVGDVDAELGTSRGGIEVTSFELDEHSVSIAGRGLDPLATAAVASQISISDDGVAVPDAALPGGLRARADIDMTAWEWQWVPGTRTTVSYSNGGDGWVTFSVRPRDTTPDVFSSAPYVLADVRYAVVGNGTGIAGTYAPLYGGDVGYVIWQLPDREYVATGTGMTLDELVDAAGSIVQPGDTDWRTDLWDEMRAAARACCNDAADSNEPSDATLPGPVVTASADDEWRIQASTENGTVRWDGRVMSDRDFVALETPIGAPLLRVSTRPRWPGMPKAFPATAVALVDRSMVGSILRLTTTGAQPQTAEVPLQPLDNDALAPYLAGAVVLPWTDGGFVAQLIAPDGQTISIQTDADLR